jgi:putative ABC transport system substrate-binding protein
MAKRMQLVPAVKRVAVLINPTDRSFETTLRDVEDDPDRAVSEMLRRGASLLIPCGSTISAATRQTSTIPIVFLSVGDPIAMGLVESLSRPGGNATGFSDIHADLSGKLVDLAKELIKPQTTVDYLWHTAWPDGQNRYQTTE